MNSTHPSRTKDTVSVPAKFCPTIRKAADTLRWHVPKAMTLRMAGSLPPSRKPMTNDPKMKIKKARIPRCRSDR